MPESNGQGSGLGGLAGALVDWGLKGAANIIFGKDKNPEAVIGRAGDAVARLRDGYRPPATSGGHTRRVRAETDPLQPVTVTAQYAASYAPSRTEPTRRGKKKAKKHWSGMSQEQRDWHMQVLGQVWAAPGGGLARLPSGALSGAVRAVPMPTGRTRVAPSATRSSQAGYFRAAPLPSARATGPGARSPPQRTNAGTVSPGGTGARRPPPGSTDDPRHMRRTGRPDVVPMVTPPGVPLVGDIDLGDLADTGPQGSASRARSDTAVAVHPGSGQRTATAGAAGSAAAPGGSAATAGKTAGGAVLTVTGTPTARVSVGPFIRDSLLQFAVGRLTKVGRGTSKARATVTQPGTSISGPTSTRVTTDMLAGAMPGSGAFARGGLNSCDCPPKRKKSPRKARTECWKGSYTESARGISKVRREQIPC